MGLLSPGGVHSHEAHIFAMLELAIARGVPRVAVHAFLDGRDTPPRRPRPACAPCRRSATGWATRASPASAVATSRWTATSAGIACDVAGTRSSRPQASIARPTRLSALQAAYARGENDEFVAPTVIDGASPMRDGDAVVFMNFRADRARQLTAAFVDPGFDGFVARRPALSRFVCLTEYDAKLPAPLAFAPDDLRHTFGEIVAEAGLTQLRIAETEKYAHVTFFFSGGREDLFAGEERILVPSPQGRDLRPAAGNELPGTHRQAGGRDRVGRFDAIVCNIANPDMVGHSGILSAAIAAAQAVDIAIGRVADAVRAAAAR
jgi:2,3-bisphosphoglycerate-independent phosphoglycerate mutase